MIVNKTKKEILKLYDSTEHILPESINKLLNKPPIKGIYYLVNVTFFEDKEEDVFKVSLVYIGKSKDIATRILSHMREGTKIFNEVLYQEYNDMYDMQDVSYSEETDIFKYAPPDNKILPIKYSNYIRVKLTENQKGSIELDVGYINQKLNISASLIANELHIDLNEIYNELIKNDRRGNE